MIPDLELLARLCLAALLGSLIGLERERLMWAAGLRTHMLVAVGAALVMIVSVYGFAEILGHPDVVLDPSRVAAQVVSGIGFLGAGTIVLRRKVIRGLTTAASLWSVAAIGLAVGGGLYFAAIATTALLLLILVGLKPLELRWQRHVPVRSVLHLWCDEEHFNVSALDAVLGPSPVRRLTVDQHRGSNEVELRVVLPTMAATDALLAVEAARRLDGVRSVRLERQRAADEG